MSNFIIFFSFFYILLLSVVAFGSPKFMFWGCRSDGANGLYTGFYGLFAITFISIISSLFVPHNFIHNILLHLIGVLFFIFIKKKSKKDYLKIIFLISIAVFSALIISKTHDDFSYYHLPVTKYLTEQKVIFGIIPTFFI